MEFDLDREIYKTHDPEGSHFKKVAIPAALISLLVVVGQYGYRLWTTDVPLTDKVPNTPMSLMVVFWTGATVLSLAMLLLAWGLYQDRELVSLQDDRLAGNYLVATAILAAVCLFSAAVPGLLIGAVVVIAVVILRRKSIHLRGPAARDAGNAVFVTVPLNLLLLGSIESYNSYLRWTDGFEVSQNEQEAFRAAHGGDILYWTVAVFAIAASLLLPLTLWHHRRHLNDPPKPALIYCLMATVALGLSYWIPTFHGPDTLVTVIGRDLVATFCLLETLAFAWFYRSRHPARQN